MCVVCAMQRRFVRHALGDKALAAHVTVIDGRRSSCATATMKDQWCYRCLVLVGESARPVLMQWSSRERSLARELGSPWWDAEGGC